MKRIAEFTDVELTSELSRRYAARAQGKCDYCGRAPCDPSCGKPERHTAAVENDRRPKQ